MNIETLILGSIWQQLLLSGFLFIVLKIIFKVTSITAEVRSWLWLNAMILLITLPVLVMSYTHFKTINIQENTDWSYVSNTLAVNSYIKNKIEIVSTPNLIVSINTNQTTQTTVQNLQPSKSRIKLIEVEPFKQGIHINPLTVITGLILNVFPWVILLLSLISLIKMSWIIVLMVFERNLSKRSTKQFKGNIYYSDEIEVPALVGFIQPKILLPLSVKTLPLQTINFIIGHEHAHLTRKDHWSALLVRLMDCFLWWNPMFHLMNNELSHTREIACDQRAIGAQEVEHSENKPQLNLDYADMLVQSVKLFLIEKEKGKYMKLISRKGFFRKRVNEVLNLDSKKNNTNIRNSLLASLLLIVSGGIFASIPIQDGQLVQNIDKIVTDINSQKEIKRINVFFDSYDLDEYQITSRKYNGKSNEYEIVLSKPIKKKIKTEDKTDEEVLDIMLELYYTGTPTLDEINKNNFQLENAFTTESQNSITTSFIFSVLSNNAFDRKQQESKKLNNIPINTIKDAVDYSLNILKDKITVNAIHNSQLLKFVKVDIVIDDKNACYLAGSITAKIKSDGFLVSIQGCEDFESESFLLIIDTNQLSLSNEILEISHNQDIQDEQSRKDAQKITDEKYSSFVYGIIHNNSNFRKMTNEEKRAEKISRHFPIYIHDDITHYNGSHMGTGLIINPSSTYNSEQYDALLDVSKRYAGYEIEVDKLIEPDGKIFFIYAIDMFKILHSYNLLEQDFKSVINQAELEFNSPTFEKDILNFTMPGIYLNKIEKEETTITLYLHFDSTYLYEGFIDVIYSAYPGKIIEQPPYHYDDWSLALRLILVK
ncbi:MAG: M56 family metallopeptidase [Saccharospirillaceae bacterium]|nr:M56 family metallopeptidase [Pseudomonadales bacterium]NRB79337.1 M56 family metallopeptidase [Saccharospirillaceae bacterium]